MSGDTDATHGRLAATLAALAAAGVAIVVHRDVLHAYFWNDDFAWLFVLHDRGLTEFLLTPMGGHTLIARNAVFALLDAAAGLDPWPWFASMLVTHAVNVALLARLIWLFTGSVVLAGVGALAWGICPAVSETLGWYAVYGQVAAATCLLVALGRVGKRARAGRELSGGDLGFVAVWLVLSSLFFGTVLAFVCAWPLVAALLVPGSIADEGRLLRVLAVSGVVVVLYAALQLLAWGAYGVPVFAPDALAWLLERPWPTVVAVGQLLRVGVTSLVLETWWTPAPRSDAVSWLTLAAAAAVGMVAVLRAPSDRRATIVAFGVLCVTGYLLIAVARAPLAGALLGQTAAEVGATMRYHYVPLTFLAVALSAALDVLVPQRLVRGRGFVPLAWGAFLVAGQMRHGVAVDVHDPSRTQVRQALDAIGAGIAGVASGDVAYLPNAELAAFGWLPNTTEPPPGLAALFVIVSATDTVDGRVVRFVEPNPRVRDSAQQRGGRTATLLVAPPDRS